MQMIMPKFGTTNSYKNIIGINYTAKFKDICCPSQTPHKIPLFLCDLKSFREKNDTQKECRGIGTYRNKVEEKAKKKQFIEDQKMRSKDYLPSSF